VVLGVVAASLLIGSQLGGPRAGAGIAADRVPVVAGLERLATLWMALIAVAIGLRLTQ
jgi:hypothetical protein